MTPAESDVEEEKYEEEGRGEYASVAHHPPAPSSELFEISTTVDPSYIISLIRKLLPCDIKIEHGSEGVEKNYASFHGSETDEHGGVDTKAAAMRTPNDLDRHTLEMSNEHQKEVNYKLAEQEKFPDADMTDHAFDQNERNEAQKSNSNCHGVSLQEDPWEEYGCILWDLSANKTHAEFMVENLLLDVLLTNLIVSKSVRITEICLGIIANLVCHEGPKALITSSNKLIETVVHQLFIDDSPCLSETCRLLTLGLQGSGSVVWAQALQPEYILCRLIWIAENTLNSQLLEKCNELFLVIVDGQHEVQPILLPPLMKLGLPNLLVNLLACEMQKLTVGGGTERYSVLDLILCVIEAISVTDNYSQVISSNKELFRLVCGVIKLPDKVEAVSSCVTAVALIANILADVPNLVSEISQDMLFLQGLLDILPSVSDDSQARNALWSILARMLVLFEENMMSASVLQQYASILTEKSDLIEEDLDDHRVQEYNDDVNSSKSCGNKLNVITTSLARITSILNRWINTRSEDLENDLTRIDNREDDERLHRLLRYCDEIIL